MKDPFSILKRPRITEKGSRISETSPTVVFEVPRDATKTEIAAAVRTVFNVEVVAVRTAIVRGKIKRAASSTGKRSNFKKAFVTLPRATRSSFFEGGAAELSEWVSEIQAGHAVAPSHDRLGLRGDHASRIPRRSWSPQP
jgi:large subunit ribosomal protein L23